MGRSIYDPSEEHVYRILRRQLEGRGFHAHPVKVKRVLKTVAPLSEAEWRMMACGEFDFVVMRTEGSRPIFGIEFDGPYHDLDNVAGRDGVKNRLCQRNND